MVHLELALKQSVLDSPQEINGCLLDLLEGFVLFSVTVELRQIGLVPSVEEVVFELLLHAEDLLNRLQSFNEEVGVALRVGFYQVVNFIRNLNLFSRQFLNLCLELFDSELARLLEWFELLVRHVLEALAVEVELQGLRYNLFLDQIGGFLFQLVLHALG